MDKQTYESLRDFSIQYPIWAFVDWVRDTPSGKIFVSSAIGVAVTSLKKLRAKSPLVTGALVALVAVAAISGVWGFLSDGVSSQSIQNGGGGGEIGGGLQTGRASHAGPTARYYPLPLTTRNLFDSDFKQMHITQDVTIHHVSPPPTGDYPVTYQLIWDFDGKTEFIAVFIPRTTDAFIAAKGIALGYQNIIDQLNERIRASVSAPGESAKTDSTDLTFSGRVFIYYEGELSLQQMAALEQMFIERKMAVEFRGQSYWALRMNEKREMPGNSVSFPVGSQK